MTIDDDNSIYVGGLPYDASEADLRRAFSLYGSVVAVKVHRQTYLIIFLKRLVDFSFLINFDFGN